MPKLYKQKNLSYTKEQLCNLVLDIDSYSDFLPWCIASRINEKNNSNLILADLVIGFKMFREKFTSEVKYTYPDKITVRYIDGPFKYLNNNWNFLNTEDNSVTEVHFDIDFEFKSIFFEKLIGTVFNIAVEKMIDAFEERAKEIYGRVDKNLT